MNWLIFIFWPIVKHITNIPHIEKTLKFNTNNSEKLSNNIVSATHSIGSIILNLLYFFSKSESIVSLSCYYSYSYFVYDGYLIALKKNIENYPYIAHHVAALIVLEDINNNINRNLLLYLYLFAEISNIPNYIIYHLIKTDPGRNLKNAKLLQVLWFSFFRIILYSFYVKDCYENIDHKLTKFNIFFIYLAGAYWSFGQFKGAYTSFMTKSIKSI
tara:strand:+ start:20343 stop:20987 length:645 start_codon:yes stop_codon:yes gene_type:complete